MENYFCYFDFMIFEDLVVVKSWDKFLVFVFLVELLVFVILELKLEGCGGGR